jgi:tetratricopeptide (TPR) repeat protein
MLTADFPNNPIFQRWAGRIEARRGQYSAAAKIFRDITVKAEKGVRGYRHDKPLREAYYYIAYDFRNKGILDSAETFFLKCAEVSKRVDTDSESGFLINSYLYLGMIKDAFGKRKEAVRYYNALLEMKEYGRSHELAKEYLEKPYKR